MSSGSATYCIRFGRAPERSQTPEFTRINPPTPVQRELFEAAMRVTPVGDRGTLAAYLHQQHPRTIDGPHMARQTQEPDSLGG